MCVSRHSARILTKTFLGVPTSTPGGQCATAVVLCEGHSQPRAKVASAAFVPSSHNCESYFDG